MKKTITTLLCVATFTGCFAQADSLNFSAYFRKRSADIALRLYQMAVKNEIKAYRTDSLSSFYTLTQLSERGQREEVIQIPAKEPGEFYDSMLFYAFVPEQGLTGIGFHTLNSYPSPGSFLKTLDGVSILFKPTIAGLALPLMPYCIFSWQELNTKLSKEDLLFLQHAFEIKAGEPMQPGSDQPDSRIHYWSNNITWYHSAHFLSDTDYPEIAELIHTDFSYRLLSGLNPDEKIFFNVHSGKYENLKETDHRYFNKIEVFVPEEFRGEFVEEDIIDSLNLERFPYSFSVHQGQPDSLLFKLYCSEVNRKEPYMVTYAVPWAAVKKRHPNAWMIWFIEDYYRQLKN